MVPSFPNCSLERLNNHLQVEIGSEPLPNKFNWPNRTGKLFGRIQFENLTHYKTKIEAKPTATNETLYSEPNGGVIFYFNELNNRCYYERYDINCGLLCYRWNTCILTEMLNREAVIEVLYDTKTHSKNKIKLQLENLINKNRLGKSLRG
jgi:hypothetical protein